MKVYVLYDDYFDDKYIRGVVDSEREADLWAAAEWDNEWEAFELGVISDE